MRDEQLLQRIDQNPRVMTGKPVIRGTRLTVEHIVNLLAHGASEQEILDEHEGLTPGEIQASLLFAAQCLQSTFVMPLVLVALCAAGARQPGPAHQPALGQAAGGGVEDGGCDHGARPERARGCRQANQ
jgi:uncharacterized protein (DUF433 family)